MKKLFLAFILAAAGATAAQARTIDPTGGDRDVVQIGHDAALPEGETVRDMVVVGGDADVRGAVERDLVVVGGDAKLGPASSVGRDVVVVAGELQAAPSASIGREKTLISAQGLKDKFGPLSGVAAASLLKGRPLAPSYWWSWMFGLAFLLLYVLIAAGAPRAVEACTAALEERPVGAFLAGILGAAGLGPFSFLLVVSVVGIAALPLLALGALAALVLGKAAVCRLIGAKARVPGAAAATAVGGLALLLLYAIPGLGMLAWTVAATFGFGCVLLAGVEALQRERSARRQAAIPAAAVAQPAPEPAPAPAPAATIADASLPRAGFWLRAGALVIDLFAWAIIGGITHLHLLGLGGWALYQIGMWVWKGTTLGGMVVGIKGARADGRPMDITVAIVRHLASYLSALPMFLGFFWAGFDPERQTWHDKIAGTIVVVVPHGQALI
jgi:uncharacterized RDD family membrane protein YckC